MRKMAKYVSPWCKQEPEIRQRSFEVQNELCENQPVHIVILALNSDSLYTFSFRSLYL